MEYSLDIFAPSVMRTSLNEFFLDGRLNGDGRRRVVDEILRDGDAAILAAANWKSAILQICLFANRLYLPDLARLTRAMDHCWFNGGALALHKPLCLALASNPAPLRRMMDEIQPLVEDGTIVFYDPLDIFWENVSKELFGCKRWMTKEEIVLSWPNLFVDEGLLTAEALGVPYTATTSEEYQALELKATQLQSYLSIDQRVLRGITTLKLPGFTADAQTLVRARQDDEAFADFRSVLRKSFGMIAESMDDSRFESNVSRIEKDLLAPQIQELQRSVRGVKSLEKHVREGAIDFSAAALGSFLLFDDPTTAAATGAMTAGLKVLAQRLVSRDVPRPAARFVYKILVPKSYG